MDKGFISSTRKKMEETITQIWVKLLSRTSANADTRASSPLPFGDRRWLADSIARYVGTSSSLCARPDIETWRRRNTQAPTTTTTATRAAKKREEATTYTAQTCE